MLLTSFSFLTALIWGSVFAIVIKLLTKQMALLRTFSIYPLIFLIFCCLIKIVFPVEFFYTKVIRSTKFLPALQHLYSYQLMVLFDRIYLSVFDVLILISAMVASGIFYQRMRKYRKMYRGLCHFSALNDPRIDAILNRVLELIALKKQVKIIVYGEISTPAMVGFRSPILLLPNLDFTDDELFGILLHECEHYRQKHIVIKFVCDMIQIIFWWNPFFKYLNIEVAHILEMHSDEKVSAYLCKEQQKSYLNAIVKVVQHQEECCHSNGVFSCCLVEKSETSKLEQRFTMLLENNYSNINKQRSKVFIPLMFIILFLSYAFVVQPHGEPEPHEYGEGTIIEISDSDYLVETDSGYNLYNDKGEFVTPVPVIDETVRHLKILTKEELK